jgi:hypothetical protein
MRTIQGRELSVAILMDDLASAKEISLALRQQNILAHNYRSLEEFWVSTNVETPDLVIVDVTKTSQGSVQFRSHPNVIDGSLSYAFFSKESTKILLQSTIGLKPVGFLHGDTTLKLQVESLIKFRKQEIIHSQNVQELESRVNRLQNRSQRIMTERSSAEEFRANFDFIRQLSAEVEAEGSNSDFAQSLIAKLDAWEAVDSFALFELNQNGQKLVAPEVSRRKYLALPSLWLGQANSHGIEDFAVDMASQVAGDLFEIDPVLLRIYAGSQNPEMLLFISFTEDRMKDFPWDVLGHSLSSSLRRLKLHQQLPQYSSQFMPMWEALDSMDRVGKSGVDEDIRIICLSLIPLTDLAKKKNQNKFYWASFFNDFFLQLSGRLQKSTKLSLFGPWHVLFYIPKENVETETQMLQSFIRTFGFWKFFEDNSQILSEEMLPILKLIPPSSSHYFRVFEKEFEDLQISNENKRLMTSARAGLSPKLSLR